MKSKFNNSDKTKENINNKNPVIEQEDSEVEAGGPGIASIKSNKTMVIVASALLVSVVLYFLFFRGNDSNKAEKLEEVINTTSDSGQTPAKAEKIDDFIAEKKDEAELLEKPLIPEIPKLPELPKNDEIGVLPSFLDLPKDPIPVQPITSPINPIEQQPTFPFNPNQQQPDPNTGQNIEKAEDKKDNQKPPEDPRKSPIIVVGGVDAAGPTNSVGYENNIIQLNKDPIDALQKTEVKILPTAATDRTKVIAQGKMLTAVLETAINTEMPGTVRGIITRDVYGESGNVVLIPRGSRLYGSYSSQITRGQGRVEINWSRLMRVDGVDVNVTFNAADQFGRSGIEGDVDNKYGSIIGNSMLTSVLAIGGAIAAEKLSGGGSVSTTLNPQQGTSTTVGKASSQAIYDVSKTIIDTVQQVVGNTIDIRPVIRVPQGTRITILVNDDMRLPPVRNYKK